MCGVLLQRYSRHWPLPCPHCLSGGKSARTRRSRLRLKIAKTLVKPLMLLMLAMIISLPGCATLATPASSQSSSRTVVITKPVLSSLEFGEDGSMCMDKHDSAELLIYIRNLERELGLRQ